MPGISKISDIDIATIAKINGIDIAGLAKRSSIDISSGYQVPQYNLPVNDLTFNGGTGDYISILSGTSITAVDQPRTSGESIVYDTGSVVGDFVLDIDIPSFSIESGTSFGVLFTNTPGPRQWHLDNSEGLIVYWAYNTPTSGIMTVYNHATTNYNQHLIDDVASGVRSIPYYSRITRASGQIIEEQFNDVERTSRNDYTQNVADAVAYRYIQPLTGLGASGAAPVSTVVMENIYSEQWFA